MEAITKKQQKKFKRYVERAAGYAFEEVALNKDEFRHFVRHQHGFQTYVATGIRRFASKRPNYTEARAILGADFISADEIAAKMHGFGYTEDKLITFGERLPGRATIEAIRNAGMALITGPPRTMSFVDLCAVIDPGSTREVSKDDEFMKRDKIASRWIAFGTEPVKGSLGKPWPKQRKLIVKPGFVPNFTETAWFLSVYEAVRGIRLWPDLKMRTSSTYSSGYHVTIGYYSDCDSHPTMGTDESGLCGIGINKTCREDLGVLVAWRFWCS